MKQFIRFLSVALIAALLVVLPALTVSAGHIRHTMEETPTPTADENETPTPDENETPTPEITPDENETPTPDENETPTPKITPDENETPKPTKKPSIVSEPTKDLYDSSNRVTNAPPTMAPDVALPDELATPVPEGETPAANENSGGSLLSDDPSAGLMILFAILLLLLALDVAVILWRKNLGFSGLLNGGIAHRHVEDSMRSDQLPADDDTPRE